MQQQTPKSEVLTALRVIFELGGRDIKVTEAILGECIGAQGARLRATIVALRHLGLIQKTTLRLTMAGLVVGAGLPAALPAEDAHEVEAA